MALSKFAGSQGFGCLQQNIYCLLHTCKIFSLDEVRPLLLITITSLPTSQKHFEWAEKNV